MRGELKIVAILSVMAFLFALPMGAYLMTFQGEGLLGNIGTYAGAFVLLPMVLLHKPLGLDMMQTVIYCAPLQFLWTALWVWLGRWWYLRRAKQAKPQV